MKLVKIADTIKAGSRIIGNASALILSGSQAVETVKNIHTAYVETGEIFSWGNAKEFITLGLSVAGMDWQAVRSQRAGNR